MERFNFRILSLLLFFMFNVSCANSKFDEKKVVYAINAGGLEHVDILGITYLADPLNNVIGTSSDHGTIMHIKRVPREDQILYQLERYHHDTFGYDIPITSGSYVMILKFCEVYFNKIGEKVFDVYLEDIPVVQDLDIFSNVGKAAAYDVYVEFEIHGDNLVIQQQRKQLNNNKIRVEFRKGKMDNPKINAIVVYKGSLDEYPKLPQVDITPDWKPPIRVETIYVAPRNYYDTNTFLSTNVPIFVALLLFFPLALIIYHM